MSWSSLRGSSRVSASAWAPTPRARARSSSARRWLASSIAATPCTGGPEVASDPETIFLTNGASEGAKHIIEMLIAAPSDGIMIPIPQYPLYSAAIRKCGGVQVDYYPDEESGWTLDRAMLEESLDEAAGEGVTVKAIVVINPGNPTGAILDAESIGEVIDFAEEHGLAIIADEVYQDNLYGAEFVSFAKVLGSAKRPAVQPAQRLEGLLRRVRPPRRLPRGAQPRRGSRAPSSTFWTCCSSRPR